MGASYSQREPAAASTLEQEIKSGAWRTEIAENGARCVNVDFATQATLIPQAQSARVKYTLSLDRRIDAAEPLYALFPCHPSAKQSVLRAADYSDPRALSAEVDRRVGASRHASARDSYLLVVGYRDTYYRFIGIEGACIKLAWADIKVERINAQRNTLAKRVPVLFTTDGSTTPIYFVVFPRDAQDQNLLHVHYEQRYLLALEKRDVELFYALNANPFCNDQDPREKPDAPSVRPHFQPASIAAVSEACPARALNELTNARLLNASDDLSTPFEHDDSDSDLDHIIVLNTARDDTGELAMRVEQTHRAVVKYGVKRSSEDSNESEIIL